MSVLLPWLDHPRFISKGQEHHKGRNIVSATTIKVEFDPAQPVGQKYIGGSEDGPVYEEMSLHEAVIERAAEMLARDLSEEVRKKIHTRVESAMQELLDKQLPPLMEEAMTTEFTVVDEWGRDRSKGTLRDAMISYARTQLHRNPNSGSAFNNKTILDKVIADQIDRVVNRDLSTIVEEAKKTVYDAVKSNAAATIAKAVTNGLR